MSGKRTGLATQAKRVYRDTVLKTSLWRVSTGRKVVLVLFAAEQIIIIDKSGRTTSRSRQSWQGPEEMVATQMALAKLQQREA